MQEVLSVSVVIPCWRCSTTIGRAISSIVAQTVKPLEVIVIDDGSEDGTLEQLNQVAFSHPSGWIRVVALCRNVGPGEARNAGWQAARGDYVAFLDADDAWHPRKLELHMEWLRHHPEVVLSGTHSTVVREGQQVLANVGCDSSAVIAWKVNLWHMLLSNRFLTRTVIVKRSVSLRFSGREHMEDYYLWTSLVATGAPCYVLNMPLSFAFREEFDPGGYSGDLWRSERRIHASLSALYQRRDISYITMLLCIALSLCKYLRRVSIVKYRRAQRFPGCSEIAAKSASRL